MSFRFLPHLGTKLLAPAPQLNDFVPSYPVPPGQAGKPYRDGWDVRRAVDQGMNRSTWVYRCVQTIASNQSRLPIVMRANDRWNGDPIDHPLLDTLNFLTSPYESAPIWRKRLSMQVLLNRQGAMIEVIRSRMGQVLALYLLPAGYTWPIPDEKTFVSAFRVQMPGKAWYDIPAENVIWIREPHPTDPYAGLTPLEAAGLAVETDWYAKMYQRNFLMNDGRPGGLLRVAGDMSADDQEELRTRFQGPVGNGYQAAGRISVVEADDIDFTDLASNSRDAQYVESRSADKDEILEAFGVPESMLGNASAKTFSNAEAELTMFWRETMLNHLGLIAAGLDVLDPAPKLFVGFDLRQVAVLEEDQRKRRAYMLTEVAANAITADEYRMETGREPIGADKLYQPIMNVVVADSTAPSVGPAFDKNPDEWSPSLVQASIISRRFPELKAILAQLDEDTATLVVDAVAEEVDSKVAKIEDPEEDPDEMALRREGGKPDSGKAPAPPPGG